MLDHTTPHSWYVMERMTMPYEAATSALGSIVPVSTIEAATDGRFEVERVHHARPGAVQGFTGRLRCGRLPWRVVSVELAIEPWSQRESIVAMRPTGRPPRAAADHYFESALAVLDALRSRLVATAVVEPLRPRVSGPGVDELPKAS